MNAVSAVVKMLVVVAMLAVFALSWGGATPVAHATGADDFLKQVRADGIGANTPDPTLIEEAKEVCDMLTYNQSPYQYLVQHAGIDPKPAALFVAASTTYFCPRFAPR